jgi:hypothetical protein
MQLAPRRLGHILKAIGDSPQLDAHLLGGSGSRPMVVTPYRSANLAGRFRDQRDQT